MDPNFAADNLFHTKRWIPTRIEHSIRNTFNRTPDQEAILTDTTRTAGRKKVFRDSTGVEWVLQPWYLTMFHNPAKNYKFLSYEGRGTSEIILPKKSRAQIEGFDTYPCDQIVGGSYNYRAHGMKHWLADVLPVAFYLKKISL